MTDFEKWMLLPKFKVGILDNAQLGKFIIITYGDLKCKNDVVNSCIEYPNSIEELARVMESALNSLLKTYHITPYLKENNKDA